MNQALAFKNIIKTSGISFNRVIPFDPVKAQLVLLDFTAANEELVPGILNDITRFSQWVNNKLEKGHARYGIGGYGEHRTVYMPAKCLMEMYQVKSHGDYTWEQIYGENRIHRSLLPLME